MVLYLPKHHNPVYLLHLPGTGVSSGTGTTYHSGTSELTPFLTWVRVIRSLVFSIVFCLPLFVLFVLFLLVVVFFAKL